jgi:bifunctional non-homologous end joining protein LigD
MNNPTLPSASLYYTEGSSDKEYHANIQASGSGYIVNFRYGRRGTALTTGVKTHEPVPLDKATKIFDKLVQEKKAKGYTEAESGAAFSMTAKAGQVTGLLPQLLNVIDGEQLTTHILDASFGFQEKKDGKRMMLTIGSNKNIVASNRKGLAFDIPKALVEDIQKIAGINATTILDGELVGDVYYVFDLLQLNGLSYRDRPFSARYDAYSHLGLAGRIQPLPMVTSATGKSALLNRLKKEGGEGIVAKLLMAPYEPGRPNSGGSQLKYKFLECVTCIVSKRNGTKRSIALVLLGEGGAEIDVGNVTVPANQGIPEVGDLVDVRFMYYFAQGSLYQPCLIRKRDDIDREACTLSQITRIKQKVANQEVDEEEVATI